MSIIWLVIAFVFVAIPTIISFLEKRQENLQTNKPTKRVKVAFLAAIAGAILSLYSGISADLGQKEEKHGRETAERKYDSVHKQIELKEDTIKDLSKALGIVTDTINSNAKYIIRLQNNQIDSLKYLMHQSLKSMDIQLEVFKQITGNGNKPSIFYWAKREPNPKDGNEIVIGLENQSKYPIHGVTMVVHELFIINGIPNIRSYPSTDAELPPGSKRYIFTANNKPIADNPPGYGYTIEVFWSMGHYGAIIQINSRLLDEKGYLKSTIKVGNLN
jgi:hypothetical protein